MILTLIVLLEGERRRKERRERKRNTVRNDRRVVEKGGKGAEARADPGAAETELQGG